MQRSYHSPNDYSHNNRTKYKLLADILPNFVQLKVISRYEIFSLIIIYFVLDYIW